MAGFGDFIREDVRLVILRLLSESSAYTSNSSVIAAGLEMMGHKLPRDTIKNEINWLAEQGLVSIEVIQSVVIATLTERGEDVAQGRATVIGVKRPRA